MRAGPFYSMSEELFVVFDVTWRDTSWRIKAKKSLGFVSRLAREIFQSVRPSAKQKKSEEITNRKKRTNERLKEIFSAPVEKYFKNFFLPFALSNEPT